MRLEFRLDFVHVLYTHPSKRPFLPFSPFNIILNLQITKGQLSFNSPRLHHLNIINISSLQHKKSRASYAYQLLIGYREPVQGQYGQEHLRKLADMDGVAVVPRVEAQRVLALAQQLDYKEHSMYGTIEQLKSIQEAQNLAVSSEIEGIPFKVHA